MGSFSLFVGISRARTNEKKNEERRRRRKKEKRKEEEEEEENLAPGAQSNNSLEAAVAVDV